MDHGRLFAFTLLLAAFAVGIIIAQHRSATRTIMTALGQGAGAQAGAEIDFLGAQAVASAMFHARFMPTTNYAIPDARGSIKGDLVQYGNGQPAPTDVFDRAAPWDRLLQ